LERDLTFGTPLGMPLLGNKYFPLPFLPNYPLPPPHPCDKNSNSHYILSPKAFSISAPSVWNSLSFDCRSAQLANSFQRIL